MALLPLPPPAAATDDDDDDDANPALLYPSELKLEEKRAVERDEPELEIPAAGGADAELAALDSPNDDG